ncbi:helix-turn-helix domain-containing protein [Acinetobacter rudis]|uniref:Helix-turn-helix transcriptional regulator n=1 Tax=Acinetobacter rudis TaxID=632955 RepID=A0AAW8JE61_9GAMM|nr:helix-turn-helix transcriptional regulator [Acinetobacter rudis]MDQ8937128.1 helix-turn-helix transcriptional regulator [Acinetobacter rudis]MDQ9019329.1 helix-turn-helix transcriptional regulator [Acinetobacter rudis]
MEALKQWLVLKRQQQNLSQLELAQILGKSISYVQHVEEGLYVPELSEYLHYCSALSADPSEGINLIDLAIPPN